MKMTYFRIDWQQFVTNTALTQLAEMAGVLAAGPLEELRPAVAAICAAAGGLPVIEQSLDETARTDIVLRLVSEGVAHALQHFKTQRRPDNYLQIPTPGPLAQLILPVTPLNLNTAPARILVTLPGIGPVLAARIVADRMARGPFTTLDDLARRINGIGPAMVATIRHQVRLGDPLEPINQVAGELTWLVERMPGLTPWERLVTALDAVATTCAASPHPATREFQPRHFDLTLVEPDIQADWIGVLLGSDYFRQLPTLLQSAARSLDVCLFHIALPAPAHPTRALLDELIAARDRGVAVRVLLDADRPSDPYRSSVINGPAQAYLAAVGVPVRFDSTERLLHSKYIIVDGSLVVLGSHNWSAGSYFVYDDLSLVIQSVELAESLTARFVALWDG